MSEFDENDVWNKYVLSIRLNESADGAALMLTGTVFHAEGPATAKERSPNLKRACGMSTRWRDDDQLDVPQQFMMYFSASWLRALNTIMHSLKHAFWDP